MVLCFFLFLVSWVMPRTDWRLNVKKTIFEMLFPLLLCFLNVNSFRVLCYAWTKGVHLTILRFSPFGQNNGFQG